MRFADARASVTGAERILTNRLVGSPYRRYLRRIYVVFAKTPPSCIYIVERHGDRLAGCDPGARVSVAKGPTGDQAARGPAPYNERFRGSLNDKPRELRGSAERPF